MLNNRNKVAIMAAMKELLLNYFPIRDEFLIRDYTSMMISTTRIYFLKDVSS